MWVRSPLMLMQGAKGRRFIGAVTLACFCCGLIAPLAVASAAMAAEGAGTEGVKLYPIDEGPSDPDFAAFRARLLGAIERRDADFLLGSLHKDIKLSFGDWAGIETFKKLWKPESADSPVWRELRDMLVLGGTFGCGQLQKTVFIAPYVFCRFPGMRFEAFEYAAITGTNVRVRSEPSSKAPVIATLSYDVVELGEYGDPVHETIGGDSYRWVPVVLPGNRPGYVNGRYIRSSIDYRAGFRKTDGSWKMEFFLRGD